MKGGWTFLRSLADRWEKRSHLMHLAVGRWSLLLSIFYFFMLLLSARTESCSCLWFSSSNFLFSVHLLYSSLTSNLSSRLNSKYVYSFIQFKPLTLQHHRFLHYGWRRTLKPTVDAQWISLSAAATLLRV